MVQVDSQWLDVSVSTQNDVAIHSTGQNDTTIIQLEKYIEDR